MACKIQDNTSQLSLSLTSSHLSSASTQDNYRTDNNSLKGPPPLGTDTTALALDYRAGGQDWEENSERSLPLEGSNDNLQVQSYFGVWSVIACGR